MYLKQLNISFFRNIKSLKLNFKKNLNIFIGENNSGKSTTIDALRICFGWGDQEKNISIKIEDIYIDRTDNTFVPHPIQFDLVFEPEGEDDNAVFYDLLVQKNGDLELQMHFKFWFERRNGRDLFRSQVWGGENEGQIIPPEILDLIRHLYLGALRDANRDLQLSKGNKLGSLLEKIVPDKEERDKLARKLDNLLDKDAEWDKIRSQANIDINSHLNSTSIKNKELKVRLKFLDSDFKKIVGDIRARVPVYSNIADDDNDNQRWFSINQNGLGDNNRIYIASVLGDLLKLKFVDEDIYVALLIEEPEAHLHPQLQNILFQYFNKLSENVQLFITSHSPTITAKSNLDSLIVFQKRSSEVVAFSMVNSELNVMEKAYLKRFLDVTKSQLFFANGVIVVEGISEALLLPLFSTLMAKDGRYDLTKCGIEIVNVGGVSFRSFAKLFNSTDPDKRLLTRCVILTDSDPTKHKLISDRTQKVLKLKAGLLDVQYSKNTFEHDLFNESPINAKVMKEVYKEMHKSIDIQDADDLMSKLKIHEDKGQFAQNLALRIEDNGYNFDVPQYIKNAISWVTQ